MADNNQKRQYVRLNRKLDVEFSIIHMGSGVIPGIDWQKGYTKNISYGGICLETNILSQSTINFLTKENHLLELKIHFSDKKIIRAVCDVAWHKRINDEEGARFIIGLSYRTIAGRDLVDLMKTTVKANVLILLVAFLGAAVLLGAMYIFVVKVLDY